ncbi:hypothetical protein D3C78_1699370 [compost metagenome]
MMLAQGYSDIGAARLFRDDGLHALEFPCRLLTSVLPLIATRGILTKRQAASQQTAEYYRQNSLSGDAYLRTNANGGPKAAVFCRLQAYWGV